MSRRSGHATDAPGRRADGKVVCDNGSGGGNRSRLTASLPRSNVPAITAARGAAVDFR